MVNFGIPAKRSKIENEEIDEDDTPVRSLKKAQIEEPSKDCPFLATIDRYFYININ